MTNFNDSDNNGFDGNPPTILLPYQEWIESAYRHVVINALKYAATNKLPGNHSFYITFDTNYPGLSIPSRVKIKYPNEMTIVLQHQFWDLIVDEDSEILSVGLSFGGVPTTLIIPFGAISAFSDPEAKLLLNFTIVPPPISAVDNMHLVEETDHSTADTSTETTNNTDTSNKEDAQVISLDAFRKKTD
ncbi:hypothetical protein CIN_12090 [Commensalibacter intestini A911]|uniref:Stringent starvation protein B n=2 Tax=Commensalibacter intestini TaxID=479936 RepID=A0A251ZX28_9PROT|nr:ClpXP protease specificity-enhancing factor SspB [Commensalibacter intestini]EHD13850.1 hypothetical protein CIN_12090 [Commensalibacter intestini A911]OUI79203.1 hypothetical protein HK18_04775 [Commensalibacter intestini]